jgi:hypothetical protein
MYEHRLYLDMAAACIDSLTHEERTSVPPTVFAKLVKVCATLAQSRIPDTDYVPADVVPVPPDMGFIKAYMLKPNDCVWRRNATFTVVESVLIEHTGPRNAVFVCWAGGGAESTSWGYEQPARIAMNRADAHEWNVRRADMPPAIVEQLVSGVYGGRRGG